MSVFYLQEKDATGVPLHTEGAPVVDTCVLVLAQVGEACHSPPVQRESTLRPGFPSWKEASHIIC
jgi:hypothetical protein